MRSMTMHRIAITKAQKSLISRTLYLELALLGDNEEHKAYMRREVSAALETLVLTVDTFKQEYLLNGSQEPVESQLI